MNERLIEDKPDIFNPFVPFDPDGIVEICDSKKNTHSDIQQQKSKPYLFYIIVLLLIGFSLKQYKF